MREFHSLTFIYALIGNYNFFAQSCNKSSIKVIKYLPDILINCVHVFYKI